jgi:hypothetical protein
MHDVVHLGRMLADRAVLRRLPCLSPDAMQFILALLSFRHLTGRTGIVSMSEVIRENGIAPKSSIINELFEAGVMDMHDDGIVVYHPTIQAMMSSGPAVTYEDIQQQNNVIQLNIK